MRIGPRSLLLFAGAGQLALGGGVPLKMLPYDNKSELQLVIDLPEGSTLERTDAAARAFEAALATVPEVTDFQSYVGRPGPIDFNGLYTDTFQLAKVDGGWKIVNKFYTGK